MERVWQNLTCSAPIMPTIYSFDLGRIIKIIREKKQPVFLVLFRPFWLVPLYRIQQPVLGGALVENLPVVLRTTLGAKGICSQHAGLLRA